MIRYKLTGRGWALAVVFAALVFAGTYALVSFAFSGEPDPAGPSGDQHLSSQTPEATPPDIPPITGGPTEGPVDPGPTGPDVTPTPDEPVSTPPEVTPVPPESPPPDDPSPSPVVPSPSPSPAVPASSPSPKPPEPSQPSATPAWTDNKVAVMFNFDSAEPADLTTALSDLQSLLPPLGDMSGYVVVVAAYAASDETAEDLAALRAQAVYDMLRNLGLPDSMIRLMADPVSGGTERYRQRADIYFLYVGNK